MPADTTPRRILVVDDNVDSAESLALLLKLSGHDVRTEFDGASAVSAAASYSPDIILLDIGLPHLNGYEAAQRIRAAEAAAPGEDGRRMLIVALTGWGQEDDRRRSRDAGIDAHLVKPVDPRELTRLIATGLAGTPPED
jgi:two-component system, chemotaxis family, CheB/CheR fusion protein